MPPIPWRVTVTDHPGSSTSDIATEPNWGRGHNNRIGFKNVQDRRPGITGFHDDAELEVKEPALSESRGDSSQGTKKNHLINFRELAEQNEDLMLEVEDDSVKSIGWRPVICATEDWVKDVQQWPANIKRKQKEEEQKEQEQQKQEEEHQDAMQSNEGRMERGDSKQGQDGQSQSPRKQVNGVKVQSQDTAKQASGCKSDKTNNPSVQQEHEWKRQQGENKHNNAYSGNSDNLEQKSEYERLREKYSPQEIALLRAIQHEKDYILQLQVNDGKQKSPQHKNRAQVSIDEADQFSPDNWLPRSEHLIRLTGKHPLNAEPELQRLFNAGLITPNELHYVRNHGAVPRLMWDLHKLEVQPFKGASITLSMDQLCDKFDPVNIPIALACDGNRRKELNMIKKSKGFSWGAGAVSCAYWKGALLRDVLLAAGVTIATLDHPDRLWINFQGADDPSEGKYETCIPLEYGMDVTNDVLLAYGMNDQPLPPDHGFPLRCIIPGYVGGRCVKWLRRIWITDKENESHYHIWDNRVLPSFVTEKDGDFAEALFRHPDTACNEQNLNSVVVKPAQGEMIPLTTARKGHTYRIAGYAYDGGGHEVQRVEVSLDNGESWLYCIRTFPDRPIRHGKKFWTWVHWHVDVEITYLLKSHSIMVRCWNVFKNTQPRNPSWNTMGMMNNCWYTVKHQLQDVDDSDVPCVVFRHPTEPGTGDGGWMKPSVENQLAKVKQDAGSPSKQFTREEIEKHDTEKDCWIVVDGKVYDATSVLEWHPGGKSAIVGHAGKVHQATSDEFASIHDDYAYQKLKECALGVVTEKAMNFIKKNAEDHAKDQANIADGDDLHLQMHRWIPAKLLQRRELSKDTRAYTFELPADDGVLGLGTCQHVQVGLHLQDKMLIRSYTPTRPVLPPLKTSLRQNPQKSGSSKDNAHDGCGTFDLIVKTYFPDDDQPGGAMSNLLDCLPIGGEIELRGPTGGITYNGNGKFDIDGEAREFDKVSLVVGGSGFTPAYSLIARIMMSPDDRIALRVVDANKCEADILLRDDLDKFEKQSDGRLEITHVLSHPSDEWRGKKGHVNADILREALFKPKDNSVVFLCGPPGMIQKAALPALEDWGYEEDKDMFGF